MAKRKSQTVMLNHSKAKILLLQKYLEKYLNIIANDGYTERIKIFDLFCGEGIYDNEGEGSPIAILNTLKDLHFTNKAKNKNIPKVDCYFNDKDEAKVEKLKLSITNKKLFYPEFGSINFSSKDYKQIVPSLTEWMRKLKNEKAFVFIDPYGYKEIRAGEIKNLLQSKKSEVLLFLPTQFMYRFDENGAPQALLEIIEEMIDLKSWKSNKTVYEFINQFKEALKSFLGDSFFVDTFTIEKDASTVYCLFFFSSHIRGFEKMLETKWQIDDDEGKGWSYEKTGDLFSDFKTNPLAEKIEHLLLSDNVIYNSTLYEFVLRNGFLPKHITEIFMDWQKEKLDVFYENGEKARKSSFYVNYENYKESPQ